MLSETNALNQTTSTTYDYALGQPVQVTDPNGVKTGAAYDSLGRMTAVCDAGDWDGINPCSTSNGATLQITYSNYTAGTPFHIGLNRKLDAARGMQTARYNGGTGKLIQLHRRVRSLLTAPFPPCRSPDASRGQRRDHLFPRTAL